MAERGVYLMLLMLCAVMVAGEAKPPQQQKETNEEKRVTNDFGPWIHISSTVLQLVPDEQTQLLLPPAYEAGSSGGGSQPGAIYFPVSHIHRLEGLLPLGPPTGGHEAPRHTEVSDNLDLPRVVKSHGR